MTPPPPPREIAIAVEGVQSAKNAFPKLGQSGVLSTARVDSDVLAANLQETLQSLEGVLAKQPDSVGKFDLDEVEFSLAVTASGGFELIGKMTAGAQAGIKIKLKRKRSN
jgi:hypothetical protein